MRRHLPDVDGRSNPVLNSEPEMLLPSGAMNTPLKRWAACACWTLVGVMSPLTPVRGEAGQPTERRPTVVTTIDLGEVVRRSPYIFRARVKRVAHTYGFSRKTGQRYTRHHRVQIELVQAYRGGKALNAYIASKKGKPVTLQRRVPAPWTRLIDHYHASYALGAAEAGDEFIAFVQWITESPTRDGAEVLLVSFVDTPAIASKLGVLIAAASEIDDARRRKMAACPTPRTFLFAGKCLTVTQLRKKVRCPDNGQLTTLPMEPTPRAYCGQSAEMLHGPFFTWRSDGDIASRGEYTMGQRSGTWTDYAERGRKVFRREYQSGRIHGRVAYYHDNGSVRLQGYMVNGQREGRWSQLSKDGKVLGSYELAGGTGAVKTFHAPGVVASKTKYRRGRRHGFHKRWFATGNIAMSGAYRDDKPHGLWLYWKEDGAFKRGECYRKNGALRWESASQEMASPDRCKS